MAQWSICNAGGSTVCPLFHMSLPNTFPFTLALSICHWGLPHGVDHVSRWWSRLSCSLLALSYFTPFYGLLQEKRCLTFSFFLAATAHAAAFIWVRVRVPAVASLFARSCFIPWSPPPRPLRVLRLPFWAVSSSPLPHRPPQIPIGDGSALEFIPHHPAELWPSNSQPLWPRQMNNKTRALRLISGKKREEKKMEAAQCQTFIRAPVPVQRGKRPQKRFLLFFCCGNSSRTSG